MAIVVLPSKFHELKLLQVLALDGHSIKQLPSKLLQNAAGLKILSLSNNKLHSLPDQFYHLTSLSTLLVTVRLLLTQFTHMFRTTNLLIFPLPWAIARL